jgi:hypothetical protein
VEIIEIYNDGRNGKLILVVRLFLLSAVFWGRFELVIGGNTYYHLNYCGPHFLFSPFPLPLPPNGMSFFAWVNYYLPQQLL